MKHRVARETQRIRINICQEKHLAQAQTRSLELVYRHCHVIFHVQLKLCILLGLAKLKVTNEVTYNE